MWIQVAGLRGRGRRTPATSSKAMAVAGTQPAGHQLGHWLCVQDHDTVRDGRPARCEELSLLPSPVQHRARTPWQRRWRLMHSSAVCRRHRSPCKAVRMPSAWLREATGGSSQTGESAGHGGTSQRHGALTSPCVCPVHVKSHRSVRTDPPSFWIQCRSPLADLSITIQERNALIMGHSEKSVYPDAY